MQRNTVITLLSLAVVAGVCRAGQPPDTLWTARHQHQVNRQLYMTSACLDNTGNAFFVGHVYDPPYMDLFALKVDPKTGDTLWSRSYRTAPAQHNWASDCVCDSAGNLYLVGATRPGQNEDMLAVKFDRSGGILWSRTWNGPEDSTDYAEACDVDAAGNLYIAGTTFFDRRQTVDVMKVNPLNGDTLWTARFPGPDMSINEAVACVADGSGSVFVVSDNAPQFTVLRFNAATGDTVWARTYMWDMATNGATLDPHGFLYITGWSLGTGEQTFKIRTDNGDTVWSKFIAITEPYNLFGDFFRQGDVDSAGDYYFAHVFYVNSYTRRLNVSKYGRASGDTIWSRNYSLSSLLDVLDCRITPDDSVLVALWGQRYAPLAFGFWNTCDYLLCGSANGDSARMGEYTIKRDYQEQGLSCLADRAGKLYQVGYYDGAKNINKTKAVDGTAEWEIRYSFYYPQHEIITTSWNGGSCGDADGHVYVTGQSWSLDYFTYKFDPVTGDTVWADKNYGWRADACCLDDSGFLYAVGQGASVIKNNALTGARIAQQNHSVANTVLYDCVSSHGALFAAGTSNGSAYVLKNRTDGALDSVWTRTYPFCIKAYGCAVGHDGGLYFCGTDGSDYLLAKIDTAVGDTIWTRKYDGPAHGADIAYDCAVDTSGKIYVTGTSSNGADLDYLTVCYTPAGDTLWTRRYDGPDHRTDIARGVAIDSLGSLYVTGSSQNACNYDIVTVKYGSVYAGTAGDVRPAAAAGRFEVHHSSPNPFSKRTQISFTLPATAMVRVNVYNAAGQLVRTLHNGLLQRGKHGVSWDGHDMAGRISATGVYLYRIAAGADQAIGKLTLLR